MREQSFFAKRIEKIGSGECTMKKYDVVIIGGGLAGIFAGYELTKKRPDIKVALLEQGESIQKRACPIIEKKVDHCINCKPCAIMRGFGGAGAFSDGKFNFTTQFGGWLTDYLPEREVLDLIDYVDGVNQHFGATDEVFSTSTAAAEVIRKRAISYDLHLMDAKCKHLGTERNREILRAQADWLEQHLDLLCKTKVDDIERLPDGSYRLETSIGSIEAPYVIAAPGRSGAEWFSEQCKKLRLPLINNQVDLGVRVEHPDLPDC